MRNKTFAMQSEPFYIYPHLLLSESLLTFCFACCFWSYIRPNFVYWSMVRATYDNEEECSSDEGFDEVSMDGNVDNNEDLLSNCSEGNDLDLDEFDNSLNKMSITPKDPLRFSFGGRFEAPTRMPSILRPSTSPESLWFNFLHFPPPNKRKFGVAYKKKEQYHMPVAIIWIATVVLKELEVGWIDMRRVVAEIPAWVEYLLSNP